MAAKWLWHCTVAFKLPEESFAVDLQLVTSERLNSAEWYWHCLVTLSLVVR